MIQLPRFACKGMQVATSEHRPTFDGVPLQTGLGGCPWRVIVASVLLNRTSHRQVRVALKELLTLWPDPVALAAADPWAVGRVVHRCGFGERRTKILVAMSRQWLTDDWVDVRDLPGVGAYVSDAVGLFCFGYTGLQSKDGVLREYANSLGARPKEVE